MSEPSPTTDRLDRVRVTRQLSQFLDLFISSTSLALRYKIEGVEPAPDDPEKVELAVYFEGPDQDLLLERTGELLLALEYLAVRIAKLPSGSHDRVRFDAGGLRAGRVEELRLSARVAAERVRASRQPFRFQPMPARERRILHLALQGIAGVRSESEGTGDERRVVIHPATAER